MKLREEERVRIVVTRLQDEDGRSHSGDPCTDERISARDGRDNDLEEVVDATRETSELEELDK